MTYPETSMHSTFLRALCLSILLSAVACSKKSPQPASSTGEPTPSTTAAASNVPSDTTPGKQPSPDAGAADPQEPDETAPAMPAAFVKFEALLLPLLREPESEAKNVKLCKMLEQLRIASLAVRRSMPKGADEAAWEAASNEMRGAFEGLGGTCTDTPPGFSSDLEIVHKSYVRLLELLPK